MEIYSFTPVRWAFNDSIVSISSEPTKKHFNLRVIDDIFELLSLHPGLKGDTMNPPFIAAPTTSVHSRQFQETRPIPSLSLDPLRKGVYKAVHTVVKLCEGDPLRAIHKSLFIRTQECIPVMISAYVPILYRLSSFSISFWLISSLLMQIWIQGIHLSGRQVVAIRLYRPRQQRVRTRALPPQKRDRVPRYTL